MFSNDELFSFLIKGTERPFSGWDFSYIEKTRRMVEAPLSWSYASKILMKIRKVESLLDMGTGGGEFLSMLQPLPKNTYATEGYKPNVPIARERLEPIGVEVIEINDDDNLPFDNNYFELVINRHSSYSPQEVNRILKPNSYFITQQVGGLNNIELNRLLGAKVYNEWKYWNLSNAVKELEETGMKAIGKEEDSYPTRIYDVGAVVYYLKAIPWQIPDFTVEKYFDPLKKIYNKIQKDGYIDIGSHRFLIIAQK